jgi:hypothetical protein
MAKKLKAIKEIKSADQTPELKSKINHLWSLLIS